MTSISTTASAAASSTGVDEPATGSSVGFRPTLGAGRIALLVVAAAAPLAAMIGNIPIGILLGNGAGLPMAFVVAAVLIACLATGYLALTRAIPEAGGFALFVKHGLGRHLGLGTAYATALSYTAGAVSLAAGAGYLTSVILGGFGITVPWYAWSALAMVVVVIFGRRAADLSAKLLVALMLAEFIILIILDVSILVRHGASAFPLASFSPSQIFSGNPGPALMVGFTSFIGIESAVLYAKEAKKPERAIPRATYAAVAVIAVFYILSAWLFIGSLGVNGAVAAATEQQGNLVFVIAGTNAGTPVLTIMEIFFCTSLLACLLALHNAASRYIHTLATDRALPAQLAAIHPKHHSPHRASDAIAGITIIVLAACALSGADPYIGLNTSLTGLFTVGVVGLQALVALATIVFFRRRCDPRIWTTLVAPAIGGIGIAIAVALIVANYSVLTATTSPIANSLPALIGLALVAGIVVQTIRDRRAEPVQ